MKKLSLIKILTVVLILISAGLLLVACVSTAGSAIMDFIRKSPGHSSDLPENWVVSTDDSQGNDDGSILDAITGKDENASERKENFYNFLVLATDKGGGNTDVMMVVSLDETSKEMSILQIPRDTCVKYNGKTVKINSIYNKGYNKDKKASDKDRRKNGIDLLKSTILSDFGIVIDRYAIMDIEGFRKIVDDIGGVEVTVQQDMIYKDPEQNLYINLKKGTQLLDGKKSEQFVRFRSGYANADLGRIDAQKIFMSSFLKKLLSSITVDKIPAMADTIITYVKTDMDLQAILHHAEVLLKMDTSKISMHTLQGTAEGLAYYSPYKKANLEIVNKHFNVLKKNLTEDNVSPCMIVKEPDNYTYTEKTAADIDKSNPHLHFTKPKPVTSDANGEVTSSESTSTGTESDTGVGDAADTSGANNKVENE